MKEFMKRKIINIAVIILSVVCMIFATSCFGFFIDTDENDADAKQVKLLDSLQSGDHSKIKALFAPNKIADIENFDEDIDELLGYYKGEYVSYGTGGTVVDKDKHYDDVIIYYDMSFNVTTTEDKYRFSIIWYVEYTVDKGNVGIWNLSVIRFDDDPDQKSSYRGDGSWTNGISIGRIHVLDYLQMMIKCLETGTPQDFKALLSPNKTGGIETIDRDIEDLYAYYLGDFEYRKWESPIFYKTKSGGFVSAYYDMSFLVETSVTQYGVAIRWCVEDTEDSGNVGIWSLYITECDEDAWKEAYWGDGLWTNGINIVRESNAET